MKKTEKEKRNHERAEFSKHISNAVSQQDRTRKVNPMKQEVLKPDTFDFVFS